MDASRRGRTRAPLFAVPPRLGSGCPCQRSRAGKRRENREGDPTKIPAVAMLCPDERRRGLQPVEHALEPRCHTLALLVLHLGRTADAQQKEMFPLDTREHQRAGDAIEHVGRRRAATPLFEPRVPRRTDVGALRHLFSPQARCSSSRRRQAERSRIELRSSILQIRAQPILRSVLSEPVSRHTTIMSRLYPDNDVGDTACDGRLLEDSHATVGDWCVRLDRFRQRD